jgi:DNA (cytosine-5)-methyltransferase 1
MDDAFGNRRTASRNGGDCRNDGKLFDTDGEDGRTGSPHGLREAADWLFCRDGKWRPVEPGTFPLAHGVTSRVGRLRAYGNAIEAHAAAAFIDAYMPVIEA